MTRPTFYSSDLAYIHDAGFGGYARRLAPAIVRLLRSRTRPAEACPERSRRAGSGTSRHARAPRPRIVEVGCGAGTVARALTEGGFDVVGIDLSPAMVRMARRRAPLATFRVGSWATARIPTCHAIIAVGEIVSYVTDAASQTRKHAAKPRQHPTNLRRHKKDLEEFFARACKALEPGGLLIFDFMESPKGRTYRRKRLAGTDWAIDMRAAVNRQRTLITRRLTMTRKVRGRWRRSHETHHVRIYSRGEMARLLRDAGFSVTLTRSIGPTRVFRSNRAAICVASRQPL